MGAKIISNCNKKGGSGKTTNSINLAHGLTLRGYNVLLVDADPKQKSSCHWHEENNGSLIPVIGLDRKTLVTDLLVVKDHYDIIVIDGSPRIIDDANKIDALLYATIRASDIVLIPIQPSPYDVWAVPDLIELIKARQEVCNKPEAAFVISRLVKNTIIGKEVRVVLEDYGIPIFDSFTTNSVKYQNSASQGSSVYGEFEKNDKGEKKFVKRVTQISLEFDLIIDEVINRYLKEIKLNKVA